MATKAKAKPVYSASDGSVHETEKQAERRSELLQARSDIDDAVRRVQKLLMKSTLTADGHEFSEWRWTDYWFIWGTFGGLPELVRVSASRYNLEMEIDHRELLLVRCYDQNTERYRTYCVNELYADEKNARKAHLAACRERMAEMQARVDKMPND